MKRVKLFALISLLFIGLGHAWGTVASVDDVLWQEQFTGTTNSTSTTFSASKASAISGAASSEKGTSMLVSSDISSLKYTASNVMLTATSGTNCSAAHIWLNKSTTGYFQVENIPLYGATKVKVSWAQGGSTKLTVQYAFDGSSSFADLSSNSTGSAEFVSTELSTSEHNSISLKFVRTSTTTNLRLDNLKLFVTEASGSSGGVTYTEVLLSQSWLSLINYSIRQRSFALRAPQLWFLGLSLVWHIVLTDTKKQQAELTAYRIDDFLLYPCIGTKFTRLVSPTSAPA